MKKTFKLSHPKIKYARLIEAAKSEAKKYLKRERNKALPKGADFWDFECKFGVTEQEAQPIHVAEINAQISFVENQAWETFYLEIIAVPAKRTARPIAALDDESEDLDNEGDE
ncbi:hypothetical protein SAMN02745127_00891 [Oceanospirillum multiglobuliferum]|uniref:Uncharacterized protein n=1 Tax=Oceanospirillum multiglobuliferum TaxID=64969 RepID=A0A1T4MRF8_9GAMM|nr:DUF6172 family protein [Oceanospirillum multiglobuliferum]OPX56918.1 hypothetical protein BTE48_00325 [Oceanospirillum multiglobuliferum]SJZ69690.1 hypothetical protein SAMN02745127_00891 [Oceanospirillum multiglobuliferum]